MSLSPGKCVCVCVRVRQSVSQSVRMLTSRWRFRRVYYICICACPLFLCLCLCLCLCVGGLLKVQRRTLVKSTQNERPKVAQSSKRALVVAAMTEWMNERLTERVNARSPNEWRNARLAGWLTDMLGSLKESTKGLCTAQAAGMHISSSWMQASTSFPHLFSFYLAIPISLPSIRLLSHSCEKWAHWKYFAKYIATKVWNILGVWFNHFIGLIFRYFTYLNIKFHHFRMNGWRGNDCVA